MVDLKSKLRARLSRRNSGIPLLTSSKSYSGTGNHGSINSPNDDAKSDKNLALESVRPTSSVSANTISGADGRGGREPKRVGGGGEAAGGSGTGAGVGAANAAPGEHKERASGFLALLTGASHSARTGSRQAASPKQPAQSIQSVDDAQHTPETPSATTTGEQGEESRLKQHESNTNDTNGDGLNRGGGDKGEDADLDVFAQAPAGAGAGAGAASGSGHIDSGSTRGTDNDSNCDTGSSHAKSAQNAADNAAAAGAATNATDAKAPSGQPPASSVTNRTAPGAGSDWTSASDLRRVSISSARVSSLASIHEDDDLAHTAAGDEPLPPPTTSTLLPTLTIDAASPDATTPTNTNPNPIENSHHQPLAGTATQSATPTTAVSDIVRRICLIDPAVNLSSSQPPTPAPLATPAAPSPSIVTFNSVAPLSPAGTVPLSPSAETPSNATFPFSTSTPANLNSNPPSTNPTATPGSPTTTRPSSTVPTRPSVPPRRQSLLPSRQTTLIRTLLDANQTDELDTGANTNDNLLPISAAMVTRKIWVKRPGSSATLVTINEEDLVDDVRDMILRKYANSLGRQFDSPDLTLRIAPRESQRQERVLGPEEPMARTLDAYFPGGQTVDEALVIDIPPRRTPKESPRAGPPHAPHGLPTYYEETLRPSEGGTDYFGPGALAHIPSDRGGPVMTAPVNGTTQSHPHTISVLGTGHIPQVPSPGGTRPRQYRERPDRPRLGRQHTSSPTILNVIGATGHAAPIPVASANHEQSTTGAVSVPPASASHAPHVPPAPPLPTPPAAVQESVPAIPTQHPVTTPPARVASPRPTTSMAIRPKKKKATPDHTPLPAGMLSSAVPPINVLIVEDNIINLKLLEAFVKRLKVRWQTAMNGREAVNKWRKGGFHLVLMDIQLPIMSGLEATREIRRLERMNSIGVFSNSNNGGNNGENSGGDPDVMPEEDKLENIELFKSPVIIVALTASSLQSDRHEALAAGCNDFLTKPITYIWLERKVMEWGCMQALIDFDGWRKWKDFGSGNGEDKKDAVASKDGSGTGLKKAVARPKRKPTAQKELVTSPHLTAQAAPPLEVPHTTQTNQPSSDDK
ncbi:hypothetical protein SMACR_06822 [Sordaria macrospora]|uniref:Response regulatory domain-containing protein n=2 Tax=Sordaria macrospora TaxID=5147 RepID=A0A8S8ZIA0_SORMA|nr:putative response regulator protein [Sordaria macrospora k-hell]KAA8630374.1 hypothetical protein SMACR_06822 [Sordaria macrospora]WPJ57664.1 hypothetical protein SMAC4_06822 [Sordaria macrospora]CCC08707.1 putative response regulator protein [Sordaria macrospora k-hell]